MECHYEARRRGLVIREVLQPYNIPDEVRTKWAVLQRERNAKRKEEDRYACPEETKRKLSITTSRAIAEGRIPRVSKIEIAVGEVLTSLGVTHEGQYRIRGAGGRYTAVIDYYLPLEKIALEVNGTFWHADPRMYPSGPVYESQRRTQHRYSKKKELLAKKGLHLCELWEMDLMEDLEGTVKTALGLA